MSSKEFYYNIPKEQRGKIIELPRHQELELYENQDKRISIPKNAYYLILMQTGILNPTIMFLDKDEIPTSEQDYGHHLFTSALEKRLGLIFEKVNYIH